MRILMVLDHEFPPDIRVENEIEALVEQGHEVHVACFTMKNKTAIDEFKGAIIHRKPIGKLIHKSSVGCLKFPFYFNFWRSFLNKLFAEYTFEAIHVHDLPLARVGWEFAKKHNTTLTLDLHENWPALLRVATHTKSLAGKFLSNNKQWTNYELKYCQLADHVVVVVDEAKERLSSSGIKPNKIAIVSNTLNLQHFEVPTTTPDPGFITLIYAGGITKHRGLQYVIKSIKYLDELKQPLRIWILGTGSYIDELKTIANKEGVEDKIFFMGWKDYKEMQTYFGKSDYCIIPHLKNDHTDSTIPHKIFQYMYAGKPMLSSNCKPLERIFNDTKCGLTYQFDDPEDLAIKLKELIASDWYASNEFVIENKKNVVEHYNWKIDAQKLNQIYN